MSTNEIDVNAVNARAREKQTPITKQERKDAALKAYEAIQEPALKDYEAIEILAWKAYEAELERIDSEPDEEIIEVDGKRYQLIK